MVMHDYKFLLLQPRIRTVGMAMLAIAAAALILCAAIWAGGLLRAIAIHILIDLLYVGIVIGIVAAIVCFATAAAIFVGLLADGFPNVPPRQHNYPSDDVQ